MVYVEFCQKYNKLSSKSPNTKFHTEVMYIQLDLLNLIDWQNFMIYQIATRMKFCIPIYYCKISIILKNLHVNLFTTAHFAHDAIALCCSLQWCLYRDCIGYSTHPLSTFNACILTFACHFKFANELLCIYFQSKWKKARLLWNRNQMVWNNIFFKFIQS